MDDWTRIRCDRCQRDTLHCWHAASAQYACTHCGQGAAHDAPRRQARPETAAEMAPAIGARVMLRIDAALACECVVMDAKRAGDKLRVLVAPVAGDGCAWVDWARCSVLPAPAPAIQRASGAR